jgi:hypothetical protein
VKALTAFPDVLAELDPNIRWTTDLGNAYYNQPQDVLQAVQVMRQRAQAAGNLQSTPQESVNYNQDAIELAPPTPQTVYVPQYDPWSVYGDPAQPYPGFSALSEIGSAVGAVLGSGLGSAGNSPLGFLPGIAMAAFNHTPWGWMSWGLNWLSQSVLFNNGSYGTRSTTVANWGLPRGGMLAYSGGSRPGYWQGPNHGPERPLAYAGRDGNGGFAERTAYRPGADAYNRVPAPISRVQNYRRTQSRLAYGPEVYNGASRGFGDRGESSPGRMPQGGYQRADYGARPTGGFNSFRSTEAGESRDFRGSSFQEKVPKAGGFHLFGGGSREPKMSYDRSYSGSNRSFFGGSKAPKMSGGSGRSFFGGGGGGGKAPKSSGGKGGHSGGHSSGHSGHHH